MDDNNIQSSGNLYEYEEVAPPQRHHRSRRRSSIAAGTSLDATPENFAIERSTCYNDFAESTGIRRKARRNSLTGGYDKKQLSEKKLLDSMQFLQEYQGDSKSIKRLRERFQRRGSLMSRASTERASILGSSVVTSGNEGRSSDNDNSIEVTDLSKGGRESSSIPLTEVHRTHQRKQDLEREHLIESLVNFSCHTPSAVLEDLISHELKLWKHTHANRKDSDIDASEGSLSSLSDDEADDGKMEKFSDHMTHSRSSIQSRASIDDALFRSRPSLPSTSGRKSALLFIDINGFTKLSTMLDVEFLSKVINSYFEMIVGEVISHGGDILKFAGDAMFCEWRESDQEEEYATELAFEESFNGLKQLNKSLSSSQEFSHSASIPTVSICVWQAAKCAASIVRKFSDYHVSLPGESTFSKDSGRSNEAMLNVHCGIGVGHMVGLHVGDYRESMEEEPQDDNAVELRREFLFLGEPIDQVSRAAHVASDGEVLASPEALRALYLCCGTPADMAKSTIPQCIASRSRLFISLEPKQESLKSYSPNQVDVQIPIYENLRRHCKKLHRSALSRLCLQMALYVHPVVRGDELAISKGATKMPKLDAPQNRHLAEAELRSVYTMFIKALVSPKLSGSERTDSALFKALGEIMHVTSRELDRYSGQLRQFIVDDKGLFIHLPCLAGCIC